MLLLHQIHIEIPTEGFAPSPFPRSRRGASANWATWVLKNWIQRQDWLPASSALQMRRDYPPRWNFVRKCPPGYCTPHALFCKQAGSLAPSRTNSINWGDQWDLHPFRGVHSAGCSLVTTWSPCLTVPVTLRRNLFDRQIGYFYINGPNQSLVARPLKLVAGTGIEPVDGGL